jgi:hypothetical protein
MSDVSLLTQTEPLHIAVNILLAVMNRNAKRTGDDWFVFLLRKQLI